MRLSGGVRTLGCGEGDRAQGVPAGHGKGLHRRGADLVVGSHPHVLQETEEYKGKMIVYSPGNFVFGSSIPETALLKVEWGQEGTQVSMIPCTSSGGFTRLEQQVE